MNSGLITAIRLANREVESLIGQIAQNGGAIGSRKALHRLGSLNLRLNEVSKFLSAESKPSAQAGETDYNVRKYRENLKTLRGLVESVQFSLLAEKTRLANARGNLRSAHAWATSLREIS